MRSVSGFWRYCLVASIVCWAVVADADALRCQIVDDVVEPVCGIDMVVIPEARVEGYGKTSYIELSGEWNLAHYWDIIGGEVDLGVMVDALLLTKSAGLQLPDQLVVVKADVQYLYRLDSGLSLIVDARPGSYSDTEELDPSALFMPVSLAAIQSLGASMSVKAGVDVRFGFERVVMPDLMIEWDVTDHVELEIGLPVSKISLFLSREWTLFAGCEWNNETYKLREKGSYDRGKITLEDWRLSGGAAYRPNEMMQVEFELGGVFDRSMEFGDDVAGLASKVDVDSSIFFGVSIGGPF